MARENVTVSIKGDIKDLEQKINQSKAIINDATKQIIQENNNLKKSQADIAKAQNTYNKELKAAESEIKKYTKIKAENGKLTKEESKELAKARASLSLYKNETKKLVDIEKQKQVSIKKNISATKEMQNLQRAAISDARLEVSTKKKIIEMENEVAKTKDKSAKSTSNLANETIRYLRWAGTIAGVVYAGQRAWRTTIGTGIEVNKIIESNTYGIAALTSANTRMIDSLGNSLTPIQKFTMGQKLATGVLENLRKEAVKTYATFPQLIEIYQQATGQTLGMGQAFGKTIDEINSNTVKLASRMSNIAGAIGMPMDRVREEIRSLLSGNASTDSLISTMIFGSPGQANQAVADAKKRVNGLSDLLSEKLKPFDVLADTKSFQKSVLTIQDAWSGTMRNMVDKSNLFNDITDLFYEVSEDIISNQDRIVDGFTNVYKSTKAVVGVISEMVVPAAVVAGIYGVSTASTVLTGATIALTKAVRANPLFASGIALATGISYVTNALQELREEEEKNLKATKKQLNSYDMKSKRNKTELNELSKQKEAIQLSINTWKKYSGTQRAVAEKQKELLEVNKKINKIQEDQLKLDANKNKVESAKKRIEDAKKEVKLIASLALNEASLKEAQETTLKNKSKITELNEKNAKFQKEILEIEQKISIEKKRAKADSQAINKLEKAKSTYQDAIKANARIITEEQQKQSEAEIRRSKTLENKLVSQNRKYAEHQAVLKEIELIENGNIDIQTRKIALSEIKLNSLAEEYSLLTKQIDKDKVRLQILLEGLKYEQLLTREKEKQNKAKQFSTVSKFIMPTDTENLNDIYSELKVNYKGDSKSLDDLEKWYDKTFEKFNSKPLTIDLKLEGFDEVSNNIATIGNSFGDMQKASEEYNKIQKKANKTPIEAKQAQLDYANATISGYGNMVGAVANFYDEDDSRREKQLELQKVFSAAKMAMQLAELTQSTAFTSMFVAQEGVKSTAAATTAVAVAAQSSPWTGFATAAAMAALMASFGIMIGGSEKTTTSYDAFSKMQENTGTGSILGDSEAKSQSISKSLDILEDYAKPQYSTLTQMNKYLASIDSKMGGVANLLLREGGFAFGEGYTGAFDTGFKNNISVDGVLGGMVFGSAGGLLDSAINKIPVIGDINQMFGSIVNSVLGGLFGKTSVSRSMTDAGITFADQMLSQALEDFEGQAYQTIKTTVTKKSWFKKSTSVSYKSYFTDLNDEVERQFQLVIDSIYDTVIVAGDALDTSSADIEKSLEDFVVSIGKVSLKGKSGDAIQEQISSIFGKMSDDIAKEAFPALVKFQKVGEGMFETLARVATGMEEAEYYISRLGNTYEDVNYQMIQNSQGDVGFEALLQSILMTEEAFYGVDNNLVKIIQNLNGTSEELYGSYVALDGLRSRVKFLSQDIEGLSSTMIYGAGSIEALYEGFEGYFENFLTQGEQLAYRTSELQKEFKKLNIEMPTTKEAFSDLLSGIDLTTESGQELYGRLIILSDQFADVADEVEESIEKLKESLVDEKGLFEDIINGVKGISNSFVESISTISNTIEALLGKKTGSDSTEMQISKYWTKRADLEILLAKGSNVTTSESEKIKSLASELSSLSSSIQGEFTDNTSITNNLVSGLEDIETRLDFSNKSLEEVILDGMSKLATEETLSDLKEYSKVMLLEQQKAVQGEIESLSSDTLTYGNYIGKQEQIDIAQKLGTSYEAAEPLISQLQNLNVSKDIQGDVSSLLGYSGGVDYDTGKASQIMSLSDYLSEDIISAVSGIESKSNEAKEFYVNYNDTKSKFLKEKSEADDALTTFKNYFSRSFAGWTHKTIVEEDYEKGLKYKVSGFNAYNGADRNNMMKWAGIYSSEFADASKLYNKLSLLEKEKTLKGYANGGYTGKGAKYEVKGFTHANEHVIKSEEVDAIGGEYAIKQMISREIMSKKTKTQANQMSYNVSNKKDGIIRELQKGQEMLQNGFNVLASQLDELIDFNDERRSEGYKTEVVGKVTAVAG